VSAGNVTLNARFWKSGKGMKPPHDPDPKRVFSPSGIGAGVVLCALLSLLSCLPQATNAQSDPKPDHLPLRRYVNDFAGMIDSAAQSQLDAICRDLDQKKRTHMAIVTVVSLDGSPALEFATQLGNRWGVGYKDNNRGVVVLLSRNEHQWGIAAGKGLESVLTHDETARLGREMNPMLRKGNYGSALLWVAQRIHDEIVRSVE
jgi:uncharacterized protein